MLSPKTRKITPVKKLIEIQTGQKKQLKDIIQVTVQLCGNGGQRGPLFLLYSKGRANSNGLAGSEGKFRLIRRPNF